MKEERTYCLEFSERRSRNSVWYAVVNKGAQVLVMFDENKTVPSVLAEGMLHDDGTYSIKVSSDGNEYSHEYSYQSLKEWLKDFHPDEF